MAHPRPYQSEYEAKYQIPEGTIPLPIEQKVAGLSSTSSKAVQEPAFAHKRKVEPQHAINDQVVRGMKFNEEKMNLENQALKFKSGMRRSTEKWPTEYKLQYGWKNPAGSPVPLLKAQEALSQHHHPSYPNKPADQDWSVGSQFGDSCDAADSDLDNPPEQKPTITAAERPATGAVKKQQQQLQHQKQKVKTQPVQRKPPRALRSLATTKHHKNTVATKSKPQVAPNKAIMRKMIEHGNDTSDSDTDSQTGQKKATNLHHEYGHKKKKKRSLKRKLVWPMVTEYQSQYKAKEAPTVGSSDSDKPPAGSPQKLVDHSDPRLLKHSPMKVFKLQPESVKFTSEYLANYQSPTKLKYKDGAWTGASPAHLLPQAWTANTADHDGIDGDDTIASDWFNQVLELRRLAAAYRHRAEGTHFGQIHLADIEGEEDAEESASTASSCSVCYQQQRQPNTTPPPRSHDANSQPTRSHDPIIPATKPQTGVPPMKSKAPPTGSHGPPLTGSHEPPTRSQDSPSGSHEPQDDSDSNSSTNTNSTHQHTEPPTGQDLPHDKYKEAKHDRLQGRLPTPELKVMPPVRKIRHHLDRTTPCRGAILTSPPKEVRHGWNPEEDEDEEEDPLIEPTVPAGVTKILPRYRRDMTSRAPIYPSHTTHIVDQEDRSPQKKPSTSNKSRIVQRNLHTTHTRVPRRKTATMSNRKIKVTEDDNLECSFCGSSLHRPLNKNSRLMSDNKPLAVHRAGTTHPAMPTTVAPQRPQKAHIPLSQQQPLSGSLLSLSSCSVASEVLQRAQHRKATFWNQRETTAT